MNNHLQTARKFETWAKALHQVGYTGDARVIQALADNEKTLAFLTTNQTHPLRLL